MKEVNEVKELLRKRKSFLREKYNVKEIGIFGSFIRGDSEDVGDIDLLIELNAPITLIEFIRMENYLSELLGSKVDLVMKSALKPHIGKNILKELVSL